MILESVHSERGRSLPFSILAKPVDSIIRKRSNSIYHFHCLAGNSTIIFQQSSFFQFAKSISSRSSTVRGILFTCRV